jgi:ADP-ribose pyrophosphatase
MISPARNEPTIGSRTVFQGRVIDFQVDTVQLENGRTSTREIVAHPWAICVVPVADDGTVLLVRQYRKAAERFLLEAPAGKIEPREDPETAAIRELREEVGYTASRLQPLAGFWVAPGWCTQYMYSYLATNLTPARLDSDEDEFIEVVRVRLSHIPNLIADATIQDAKSVASLLLAMRVLGDN